MFILLFFWNEFRFKLSFAKMIINMNYKNIEKNNINLGIQILRTILCFWVLSFHNNEKGKIYYFIFFITSRKFFHVPCFSFISFYFSYNIFFLKNITKTKNRLERLLIPYILWPIVIFVINNIFNNNEPISLYELKLQILLGAQFLVPLWYLFGMIFLTILFYIISVLLKTYFLSFIHFLCFLSYISQYSCYYTYLAQFKNGVRIPISNTLGIFPLCILGLSFSSSKIIEILKSNRRKVLFLSYISLYMLFRYFIFISIGFYKGIEYIFSSLFLFLGFYFLPLDNVNPFYKKMIKVISSYTNGIYCLHRIIINVMRKKFGLNGNMKTGIIIYMICYFISFIGIKILGKSKLKYLFI